MSLDHPKTVALFSLVATKAELKQVADMVRAKALIAACEACQVAHLDSSNQLRTAKIRYLERAESIRHIYEAAKERAELAHQAAYRLADKLD